ncbi:MAG: MASE1 domain-containing protein [Proteobacteria bacterium]|nr:MASE1 domain-containing protein [Pseudomonadota bacterium]
MRLSLPRALVGSLTLAAAYYGAARLGLQLQFEATQATPVWPPSGLAFAALLLFGPRLSTGVFLGAFLANLVDFHVKADGVGGLLGHAVQHPEHVIASVTIGLGNTLEPLLGSVVIRRLAARATVSYTIRGVFLFVLATLACSVIASTIGVASLVAIGALPTSLMSAAGFTWWLGDATGMWIVAPLVVAWARAAPAQLRAQMRVGALLALGFLLLMCALTFSGWLERLLDDTQARALAPVLIKLLAHMLIPLLLWIEFRFGHLAGTLGTVLACGFAVLGTIRGLGPFVGASQNESLLVLQGFIGVASIAVLLLDAALRERRRALEALTEAHDQLEQRVRARTAELERETAERRRAEEILHQAQKMEAIGQLTGGIAHDFNNLLTVILGSLSLADALAAGSERLKRFLNAARRAAERGAGLTKDLLAFSRRQPLRAEVIEPAPRLVGACNLLRRSLQGEIQLDVDLARDLSAIEVDPGQLELALLNVGLNARDAMPEGGTLAVRARNVRLDDPAAGLVGAFVAISVSDTGVGIAPELQVKVFEPFFTTKEVGKGSGLGLSQAYGFVTQSGGTIKLESAPGQGTTVTFFLPATTALPKPAATAPDDERATAPAHGTGLVVEDDDAVAEVAAQLIGDLGYAVRATPSARAALELLRQGEPIDLVFSDIMMPGGMNGVELGRAVRAHFPTVGVLLATGFSDAAPGAEAQGFRLITKPYHAHELATALAALMHERQSADRPVTAAG